MARTERAPTGIEPHTGNDLHLRNARILTMDPGIGDLDTGELLITDGRIEAVGRSVPSVPGHPVLDVAGAIVIPGLVETHTHMWNGVWRSLVGSGGPSTSYYRLGVEMGRLFTPADSYAAVRASALEALEGGITTVHNWSHNVLTPEHADAEVRALLDSGIRSRFSYGYHWTMPQDRPMDVADAVRVRDAHAGHRLLDVGVALRNDTSQGPPPTFFRTLSVPPEILLEEAAAARASGLPLTMHMRDAGPAGYVVDRGYVGADNLLVHGYDWTPEDWRVLAGAGARCSIAPYTALLFWRRFVPLAEMLAAPVPVGLSFDILAASGTADLFKLMQTLVVNESVRGAEPLTWRRALELATVGGATALGMQDRVGSLTPGKRGDVVVLDRNALGLAPVHDLPMTVVAAGSPGAVDTVVVDGRVVKRRGRLTGWDRAEIVRDVESTLSGLLARR